LDAIPLPPPYKGQRDDIPLADLQSPYAQRVMNFNLDDGSATIRRGDSVHATTTGQFIKNVSSYGSGATEKLFCLYDDAGQIKFADATAAGVPSVVYSPAGATGDSEIHTLFFNNVLTFFGEDTMKPGGAGCPQYNGSAWGLSGYTYPTMTNPFGGTSYKNRAYIIERLSTKYAYSGINAISGVTTEVDLAQVIRTKGNLYGIRAVSLSEGVQQESVLCFIFDTGEVLAYAGSYPNAADWTLVAQLSVSSPVYYNAFVDANGDSFIISESGMISLRSVLTQGVNVATMQSISTPIQNRWDSTVGLLWRDYTYNQIYIKGIYDRTRDRIVITLPGWVDPDEEGGEPDFYYASRFIYSLKTQSWFEHKIQNLLGFGATSATFFGRDVMYGGNGGVRKMEGQTECSDGQFGSSSIGFPFDLILAPLAAGRSKVFRAEGMDVIMKTDSAAYTTYQLISDLGVTSTVAQKVPSSTTSLQKTFVNIGLEGSYIQCRITGSTSPGTSTMGLKIYGLNVWPQPGKAAR
jgi:hypothetical protein